MSTKPIPEGYHTVTPYLAVDDAGQAIEYYKKAFGAKERLRMEAPGGRSSANESAADRFPVRRRAPRSMQRRLRYR